MTSLIVFLTLFTSFLCSHGHTMTHADTLKLNNKQKPIKGEALMKEMRRRLSTLSIDAKRAMLDRHNEYRSSVALGQTAGQPAATNMNYLRWDEGLELLATNYADKCTFSHNPNRESEYRQLVVDNNNQVYSFPVPDPHPSGPLYDPFRIGENLYYTSKTSIQGDLINELLASIDKWYDEYRVWDFNTQTCYPEPWPGATACGHYEQITWANTRYVGCGYKECPSFSGGGSGTIIVCNYFLAGNWVGQKGYEETSSGSNAATNCDSNDLSPKIYNGLCAGCPDYSVANCEDGVDRHTFSPTLTPEPTTPTTNPTPSPTNSPTAITSDPTRAPTPAPVPTIASQDIELEAFTHSFFNGDYYFQSLDANGSPYYTKTSGPTMYFRTTIGSWVLGTQWDGPYYSVCRCGEGYTDCDENNFLNCQGNEWSGYSSSDSKICAGACPDQ